MGNVCKGQGSDVIEFAEKNLSWVAKFYPGPLSQNSAAMWEDCTVEHLFNEDVLQNN